MSSNQFLLAFHSTDPVSPNELAARVGNVTRYVQELYRDSLVEFSSATTENLGVLSWSNPNDTVRWPQLTSRNGREAALWVNFPEHDALACQPDPFDVAQDVTSSGADVSIYGAPFACALLARDTLTVVNDSLGLARIYQFDFGRFTVWATRAGLAHIFAGVQLEKNEAAWAGMATLGWNIGGESHIGRGVQLPGRVRITASRDEGVRTESLYADWAQSSRSRQLSWEGASTGIAHAMSVAKYFERQPIADLSGGKDSRVLAAAALRSGVTTHVRTLRTDHGEVEIAEILVGLYSGRVDHEIRELASHSGANPTLDAFSRLVLAQKGHEGALLPATAVSAPAFRGFVPPAVARVNGHGGESLQGGALYGGRWKSMLEGKGGDRAIDRLEAMVNAPLGTSRLGRDLAMDAVRARIERGKEMEIVSAHGLLNYFYNAERMPFWASSFSNRATLTPYYSSGLLHHVTHTYWGESDFSTFHRDVLSGLIPEWSSVPFYKPSGVARRATRFFWESEDWTSLRAFVHDRLDRVTNFDRDRMVLVLEAIQDGDATKALEVALARFLWEDSVSSVIEDINDQVASCVESVRRI